MELFDPYLLDNLVHLPDMCIYGFINEDDKKIYIGHTYDLLLALHRNLKEIKYSNHPCKRDLKKLKFIIIETLNTRKKSHIRHQYWINDYSNKGYRLYRRYKACSFKLRIDLLADFRYQGYAKYLFYVKLLTKRYKELTVGVFDNIKETESFVSDNYKSIDNIIYSDNALTKEYLNIHK